MTYLTPSSVVESGEGIERIFLMIKCKLLIKVESGEGIESQLLYAQSRCYMQCGIR